MKVVIGIATTGDREEYLQRTIASLKDQCDEMFIYRNDRMPEDYTDNAKFIFLTMFNKPIYYFSCDDDIIYPPDYVSKTIREIEKHKCIVTYHGRILRGLNRSYYEGHTALSCKHSFISTHPLDVAGTGVTAFRTDYFNPIDIYKSEDKCMSDLVFSLEAAKQGKTIMHIGHEGGWIIPQDLPKGTTIYEKNWQNCKRQSEIADEIWKIKN